MYARTVRAELKPNCVAEFTRLLEKDVIPVLRKQRGFKDELAFLDEAGKESLTISLWEEKENAEAYDRATFPQMLKTMEKVILGPPKIHLHEVTSSTFHKVGTRQTV